MAKVNYEFDNVNKMWLPTQYPVKDKYDMAVPEEIRPDFNKLTTFIEDKYAKEFLKVCAFYNKLFSSLKEYDYSRASYNAAPFTLQNQERADTGTGMASNYLKIATDLVVSRIGNMQFDYSVVTERPTVQYTIFKDDIERVLKSFVRKNDLHRLGLESFHDAAILSFAHAFIDPWAGTVRKISDWELGFFESEFATGKLSKVLIRDFAFPVSQLGPYLEGFDPEKIEEWYAKKTSVDLRLYIDCTKRQKYVAIGSEMSAPTEYPFDSVLLSTMSWDVGVRKTTVASLFDTLYPLQRQLDKLLAKKTQILNQYKGPVPVFSGTDYDVVIKQMNNTAGEILFLDTNRRVVDLLTVLEPTPLDPSLSAERESITSQIFELAGVQNISMDMENYRSAAAVVALDQIRDAGFQSQLSALAQYTKDIVHMFIAYQAEVGGEVDDLEWKNIKELFEDAYIEITPVHSNSPSPSDKKDETNYMERHVNKLIVAVCKGIADYSSMDFSHDALLVKQKAAQRYIELSTLKASSDEYLMNLRAFLVELFIDDVVAGIVPLQLVPVEESLEEGEIT